jgi:hypothetical protein
MIKIEKKQRDNERKIQRDMETETGDRQSDRESFKCVPMRYLLILMIKIK